MPNLMYFYSVTGDGQERLLLKTINYINGLLND